MDFDDLMTLLTLMNELHGFDGRGKKYTSVRKRLVMTELENL